MFTAIYVPLYCGTCKTICVTEKLLRNMMQSVHLRNYILAPASHSFCPLFSSVTVPLRLRMLLRVPPPILVYPAHKVLYRTQWGSHTRRRRAAARTPRRRRGVVQSNGLPRR